MYSLAPRCSEAWSSRSIPAGCRPAVSAATAGPATSPNERTAAKSEARNLVMRGHPFRHRLGPVDGSPQGHGDEEGVVEEGQDAADDRLHRVRARAGADLHQPHERDDEHAEHDPGQPAAVAVGLDLGPVE